MEVIEFQQCLDEETAADTIRVLKNVGIPYRKSSGQPAFDVSSLGSSSQIANQKIIISVAPADYAKARGAMEAEALLVEIPDDYHLQSATADELREILQESDDWSPFDVAHARRLLDEKGIEIEAPETLAARHLANLRKGKRAPRSLLVLSIVLPVLGVTTTITLIAIIGCGIALSIAFMKSKTLEGRYPTFDKRSRTLGFLASIWALGITIFGLYLWGRFIRYGDFDLYLPG